MFNWITRLFKKQEVFEEVEIEEVKPIIITIHGFGRRGKHEFDNLILWGKKDDLEIVNFNMYELDNEKDNDWMKWVQRCKEFVDSYKGREIYLVGFSMGGVIATYLSYVCDIKKLVLIAPAFQYINLDMVSNAISKSAQNFLGKEKSDEDQYVKIPKSFYGAFSEVIKNLKKYALQIKCPVLLIHGDCDEVINLKSSLNIYDRIPVKQKRLIIMHEGHHRLLMDKKVNYEVYQIMKLFFDDKIILDNVENAPDYLEELIDKAKNKNATK